MKVHLASITHRHGTNLYAGGTAAELRRKLVDYCHENDSRGVIHEDMSDMEVVEAYFDPENYGSQEFLETDSTEEITLPPLSHEETMEVARAIAQKNHGVLAKLADT